MSANTVPVGEAVRSELARLAAGATTVVVAVSGGSDSVALLRALAERPGPKLVVAHLDHGLRPESAADAGFVEALAADLDLPFRAQRSDVAQIAASRGENLEAVARTVRYAFLTRVAKQVGADAIATGHTRNDQAETVLLQLLRGAAHPGGIAPQQGRVVRPLLLLSRADLRTWLDALGQVWREDASNHDLERDRAWVRHRLLPQLERRRGGATVRLARFGRLQRDQGAFLRDTALRRFGSGPLARAALAAAPRALRLEALAELVRSVGGTPDGPALDRLDAALMSQQVTRRDLPGGVRVRLLPERVDALSSDDRTSDPTAAPPPVPIAGSADLPPDLPATLLSEGDWCLRAPAPGDRIRLLGGTRTVADVLTDAKIPREERGLHAVLASGSRVVWIEGIAVEAGLPEAAADPDLPFMRRALELADEAAAAGETPVGAVVVQDGRILGEGRNRREQDGDPLAHAEILALRAAAAASGDRRLTGATLVVTLEPCPMCAGAILQTGLARVVFAAANHRDGAMGSVVDLPAAPWKRVPEVRGGLLARAAGRRLEAFFRVRRDADT